MTTRHLLSVADLECSELNALIQRTVAVANSKRTANQPLAGETVGLLFNRPSTRTRTAFTVAVYRLGANTIHYGKDDLQTTTGESLADTAAVLSSLLSHLIVRTAQAADLEVLTTQSKMAVINGLTDEEHPTQSVADLGTILEVFGRFEDIHVLFVGEGNNIGTALALAIARIPGMRLTLVTPPHYGLPTSQLEAATEQAKIHGSVIHHHHEIDELERDVDVVYTTRWRGMGQERPTAHWYQDFEPYRVTGALLERVCRCENSIFMHDLPAERGAEVSDDVLFGPRSKVLRQAQYKFNSAVAILEWSRGIETSEEH